MEFLLMLFPLLFGIGIWVLMFYIYFRLMKKAVREGTIEAYDEMERRKSLGYGGPGSYGGQTPYNNVNGYGAPNYYNNQATPGNPVAPGDPMMSGGSVNSAEPMNQENPHQE